MEKHKEIEDNIRQKLSECIESNGHLDRANSMLDNLEEQLEINNDLSRDIERKVSRINRRFGNVR